jgi:hypothetical protein
MNIILLIFQINIKLKNKKNNLVTEKK